MVLAPIIPPPFSPACLTRRLKLIGDSKGIDTLHLISRVGLATVHCVDSQAAACESTQWTLSRPTRERTHPFGTVILKPITSRKEVLNVILFYFTLERCIVGAAARSQLFCNSRRSNICRLDDQSQYSQCHSYTEDHAVFMYVSNLTLPFVTIIVLIIIIIKKFILVMELVIDTIKSYHYHIIIT